MSINTLPKFLVGVSHANNLGKLTRVIPDTKACKNITRLEKNMFYTYIKMKPFMLGITPEEIENLNKLDDTKFAYKSYDLLVEKLGIGKDIRPNLEFFELPHDSKGMYDFMDNIVYIDHKKMENLKRIDLFRFLRHELQHYIQRISILRNEQVAPKAIKAEVKHFFEIERKRIRHICLNYSEKDFHSIAFSQKVRDPQELYETLLNANKCIKNNDFEGFNKICKKSASAYHKKLLDFRSKVIKEFGIIKKDSILTTKIESDFKEFYNLEYKNPDGTIDNIKYKESKIEDEAYISQDAVGFEYSQEPCFMRYAKEQFVRGLKDEATLKSILETCG